MVSANGGPLRRLTGNSGAIPSWSNDGKWIYFTLAKASNNEIWKASSAGGAALYYIKEIEILNGVSDRAFAAGADSIYYLRQESSSEITIRRFHLATREDTRITFRLIMKVRT